MKATVTSLVVCLAITLATATTQARQTTIPLPPQTPQQAPAEVVLTGCVVQGSSPSVFLLDNAKKDPNSTAEKGARYFLASTVEDVNLRAYLNQEVRVVGLIEAKVIATPVPTMPPDPQRPVEEKDLPKFNAQSVTTVSDTCPMVR